MASKAVAFYCTLAAAAILGVAITLSPIDPIKALYWTAVINGVVAVPVMTIMMLMTAQPRIMGKFTISGWLAFGEFCLQLSRIKPGVDVAHRWGVVERALANSFDGVAATAFFLKDKFAPCL